MTTIRWGMIGCGDVAEVKSGPGFYKARDSTLVAVMRRNGALAADYARRHGIARWHDDAEAVIAAPDIDAIYIATLTDSHRDYTLRCAASGKAVYVEKPMAMDPAECREMIAACAEAGGEALGRLLSPRVAAFPQGARSRRRWRDRRCAAGPIAAIRSATGGERLRRRCRAVARRSGTERRRLLLRGGLPYLRFLDFLFGPIEDLHGVAGNKAGAWRPEDTVVASYRFASGVFGCGAWCYAADHDFEMNEIVGSRGSLSFSTSEPLPIRLVRGGQIEEIAIADPPHVHQPLIQTIVDELNGVGRCPSTGESGARTAAVMGRLLTGFVAGPTR